MVLSWVPAPYSVNSHHSIWRNHLYFSGCSLASTGWNCPTSSKWVERGWDCQPVWLQKQFCLRNHCNQERELTRKGQEPFRLKRNFGLQTKKVNWLWINWNWHLEGNLYQSKELPREGAQLQENGKLSWWHLMKGIRWCSCLQQRQHKHNDSPGRFSVFQMCMHILCVGGGVVGMHIYALQLCWKLNERSSLLMLSLKKGNILCVAKWKSVAETGLLSIHTL